ncbi:MAG: flavodoxin domain-containing protein [Candidatus Rifleibacteriota bacterium]
MKHQICNDIYWVGALEWSKAHFHGHELSIRHGTSYNSYFIDDEKKVLIDLVRVSMHEDLFRHIEEHVKVEELDILIINHAEPDHASSLPLLLERNPKLEIYVSRGGKISVSRHNPGLENELKVVKTGDSISIGKRTLSFFEAQMLHWPDTMFTYCPEEKVLFSADAFGQHFASTDRFADLVDSKGLWFEAEKYYANILTPYSPHIIRKLDEFTKLNWEVGIICPAHGVCWRKNPGHIIAKYTEWASGKTTESAVIIFDTIWGGTEKMARAIARGLEEKGVTYKIFSAGAADLNDVMTEILTCKAVVIGCPTLNNGIMPTLTPYLEELRGLRFRNKIGFAFGTYGWSGECVKRIEEGFKNALIEVAMDGFKCQFNPHESDLQKCEEMGQILADKIKQS